MPFTMLYCAESRETGLSGQNTGLYRVLIFQVFRIDENRSPGNLQTRLCRASPKLLFVNSSFVQAFAVYCRNNNYGLDWGNIKFLLAMVYHI